MMRLARIGHTVAATAQNLATSRDGIQKTLLDVLQVHRRRVFLRAAAICGQLSHLATRRCDRFGLAAIAFALLAATPARAGSVRATLDRAQASIDDEIVLTLTVIGDSEQPELPASMSSDFDSNASGQASQVSLINGRMSSSTRYSFTLVPKHSGVLAIPAIPVSVDGVRMSSDPMQITVTGPRAGSSSGEDLYVTADLAPATGPRSSTFVGEQLIYTVRIHARVNAQCPSLHLPDFKGAAVYDLGDQRQYKTREGDDELSVVEVNRAVFPNKPGVLEVPAIRLQCTVERDNQGRRIRDDFGTFFGGTRTTKVIRSSPQTLRVEPLPPAPDSFSGLVGAISVNARLSKPNATVGESVALTLVTHGNADMAGAPEPSVRFGDAFKVYSDKPAERQDVSGGQLIGERIFEKALVAQRAGDITIPIEGIVYFDPVRRAYATTSVAPLLLHVGPQAGGVGSTAPISHSDNGAAPTDDLGAFGSPPSAPVSPSQSQPAPSAATSGAARSRAFTLRGANPTATLLASWLTAPRIFILLVLPLVVALALRGRTFRRAKDPVRERREAAARSALARLTSLANGDAIEVSRIVRELIGERLTTNGRALSTDEALESLKRSDVPTDLVARTRALLLACDAAIYGGTTNPNLCNEAVALTRHFAEGV